MPQSKHRILGRVSAVIALLGCVALAAAQDDPPPRATEIPSAGFWPTQTMIDRSIDRICEGLADEYEFDDYQIEQTKAVFRDRFPRWMEANRAEMQTLINQYFETLLQRDAPTPAEVATWSQRVLPLFNEFEQQILGATDDMRGYLTEDQVALLDANIAGFTAGAGMVRNKLGIWAEGGYDPKTEWIRGPEEQRQREEAEKARIEATMEAARSESLMAYERSRQMRRGLPTSQPAAPDEWEQYTRDFIARYQLNPEQQAAAERILSALKEQREIFLKKNLTKLAEITERLKNAPSAEAREAAEQAFDKFSTPLERMFQMLKERLDKLPTRAQRAAAVGLGENAGAAESGGGE